MSRVRHFSVILCWVTGSTSDCFQGLSTHKQSDLFQLSISESDYLITSGGQHIPLSIELWRAFFMSEVDGISGEELIINPQ